MCQVGSIMCSYNKINGVWSCENPITLKDDLKNTSKFKGYVMSDWGATHSTSIMQGLDVEMPSAKFMNPDKITAGLKDKSIDQAAIDDAVYRILYAMFAVGVMDEPLSAWDWNKLKTNSTTEASVASSRRLSAASTVLLKNDQDILPLPTSGSHSYAVLGFASDNAVVHGGGSGKVVPSYVARPLDGVTLAAGADATVTYNDGTDLDAAAALAADSDYAIVFVGTLSHEGKDRDSLSLDDGCRIDKGENQCIGNNDRQNELITRVAAVNPNTIVVASIPGAIVMPWSRHVNISAILVNFLGGQQAGNAIADVLFGLVNPSARLPITLPNTENDLNFSLAQWPGLPDPKKPEYANYTEQLLIGYRYYDAYQIDFTSGYPFGHGLSYTTFNYSQLVISSTDQTITFDLENTGAVAGAEVAQVYLGFPAVAGEPPLQLKGFSKVNLEAGQKKTVTINLTARDLSIWNVIDHDFTVVKGDFQVQVGASSRDLRLNGILSSK